MKRGREEMYEERDGGMYKEWEVRDVLKVL